MLVEAQGRIQSHLVSDIARSEQGRVWSCLKSEGHEMRPLTCDPTFVLLMRPFALQARDLYDLRTQLRARRLYYLVDATSIVRCTLACPDLLVLTVNRQ